ncbi:MAG TPA: ferritin-like domain-containing protein [Mycobacteriales bacterium]|nr:ferritin-like domain-containing protein [Mycobacteriales bacterium]
MADDDPMDVPNVIKSMSAALRLQWRSALHYALLSGTLTGLAGQGLAARLSDCAALELADAQRLVEKLVAVGGTPPVDVAPLPAVGDHALALTALADAEDEAIAALHAVIEFSGQEPRSEALEHLIEHLILRKQQQVDLLRRVLAG